jgi:hypothetical protein
LIEDARGCVPRVVVAIAAGKHYDAEVHRVVLF